jgi:large subunit ribosomal protein L15
MRKKAQVPPKKPVTVKSTKTVKKVKKTPAVKKEILITTGIHNLKPPKGAHKPKKLLGRGSGSGHGKTSTRGSKGQTSRTGRDFYPGFEGGQTPLIRRVPKRGFVSKVKEKYAIVNLENLNKIKDTIIGPEILVKSGLVKKSMRWIKILADGEIKNPVTVQAHAFSKQAIAKIQKAGGKAEVIHA